MHLRIWVDGFWNSTPHGSGFRGLVLRVWGYIGVRGADDMTVTVQKLLKVTYTTSCEVLNSHVLVRSRIAGAIR